MSQSYRFDSSLRDYHLPVGDGHQIAVKEYGNSEGIPVIVNHGGPGSGLNPNSASYFNPKRYRVILYSQRGCGDSTPYGIEHNAPNYLVEDINLLMAHLGLEQSLMAGGSWGACLSLLFAHYYPEKVKGLILWATFVGQQSDLEWLYGETGAGAQFYPECYQQFSIGGNTTDEILAYYRAIFNGEDELAKHKAAKMWTDWDRQLNLGIHSCDYYLSQHEHNLQQAQLMVHYFSSTCYEQLRVLSSINPELKKRPIWFVHGRFDLVCRYSTIQSLASSLNAQLFILDGEGHSGMSDAYYDAIRRAADLMLCRVKP